MMSRTVEYAQLRSAGFSDTEIQEQMRPALEEAGFADQEINAYFLRHQPEQIGAPWEAYRDLTPLAKGFEEAGRDNFFLHGLQGSVSGLWARETMPDAVTPEAVHNATAMQRFAMNAGTCIGDLPAIAAGGAIGLLGGPASPVTVPAGAMGLTEGIRASYMARIASGHTDDFLYLGGLAESLQATAKGAIAGGAAGGAGVLAGRAASALGASALQTNGAGLAAETAAVTAAASALQGTLPHPADFVDAAMFIGTLRGLHGLRGAAKLVPKLREIYARIGKLPEEVAEAARTDRTVLQDVLSSDRVVPEKFATDILNKAKSGYDVPVEDLYAYKETLWAQALLHEKSGIENIKSRIGDMVDAARKGNLSVKREAWGFIDTKEAAKLSRHSGIPVEAGYTHTIGAVEMRHILNEHAMPLEAMRGQVPLTRDDIVMIPEIVRGGEAIIRPGETTGAGLPSVVYEKALPEGYILIVEEARAGKRQLP